MFKNVLSTPTTQLGRAGRFVVFQIKLWSHCARLLRKNRAGQQAAALSYHTIFGIVPLAIIMLLIFQWFPAYRDTGDKVKSLVYNQLHLTTIEYPSETEEKVMLTEHLDRIISDFFAGVDKGSITIFSLIFVIWAALALLSTIEGAFNNIWHVVRGRSFLHRIINYWALLTLGPLLIGLGVYVATRYTTVGQIQRSLLSHIGPAFLSYVVATVAFFLLYFVLPNTKVQARAAIWGAAVAALVWTFAKWGFGKYVTVFIPYSKVYGALGLIPLGVFWIFITWLIVLFGLQLTFTTQHLKTLDAAEIASSKKTEQNFIANDLTIISIMREIAVAFKARKAPVAAEVICSKLDIPGEFGEKILNHLVSKNLLVKTSEPITGFMPATAPENIRLSQVSSAVADASFGQQLSLDVESLEKILNLQKSVFEEYNLDQILTDEKQVKNE